MKNILNVEIGKRVREQRELMGYTREKFAEAVDISERFATDIELGNRGMSFATLIKVCKLFSVSTDYIIMGKQDENVSSPVIVRLASEIDEKYMPQAEQMLKSLIETIRIAEEE